MERNIWVPTIQALAPYKEGRDIDVRTPEKWTFMISVGDTLVYNVRPGKPELALRRLVIAQRCYPNFTKMLEHEDQARMFPGRGFDKAAAMAEFRYKYSWKSLTSTVYIFELACIPEQVAA